MLVQKGLYVGRVWHHKAGGPCLVALRNGQVTDITSRKTPTLRDLLELDDIVAYIEGVDGKALGPVEDIFSPKPNSVRLLAPNDLQAVKACGVTFVGSMLERVIEERAAGDPKKAGEIRNKVLGAVGTSLRDIVPGSGAAAKIKQALIQEDMWSQYLEVGIGPDAEVFSKAQVLSSVGSGDEIGILPASEWNNPEPEIVLAVNSTGKIRGATLGNDVNLRDIEGRSALLLSKAKDNNASCAIGPFIRVFDDTFGLEDVRNAELELYVEGADGFTMRGHSSMSQISRDPTDLVRQVCGKHHQYPDGFMLFLGTLFAPTQDRDTPGEGFTHKVGDVVTIRCDGLGSLQNTVNLSTECPPWSFGISALMRNLATRNLL